mmetsp:Transcript_85411/g.204664  ORF Transcript_85411/g.204664 Transcript_85411/m.204664 type:complete len:225 (-) Transcript_85411:2387-3061(-)
MFTQPKARTSKIPGTKGRRLCRRLRPTARCSAMPPAFCWRGSGSLAAVAQWRRGIPTRSQARLRPALPRLEWRRLRRRIKCPKRQPRSWVRVISLKGTTCRALSCLMAFSRPGCGRTRRRRCTGCGSGRTPHPRCLHASRTPRPTRHRRGAKQVLPAKRPAWHRSQVTVNASYIPCGMNTSYQKPPDLFQEAESPHGSSITTGPPEPCRWIFRTRPWRIAGAAS